MDEGDGYSPGYPGGDIRSLGFANQHKIFFDFVPNAHEIVVQFGSRWSWVGPDFFHDRMLKTNFEAPEQGERVEMAFDFDRLPQVSILGRLSGFSDQELRTYILTGAARQYPILFGTLDRAPTQKEVDIISESQARAFRTASSIPMIGITAALIRAQMNSARGKHHLPLPFRFPFRYGRGANFEPGVVKIPFTSRILLSGNIAFYAQGVFRNFLYFLSARIFTKPLVLMWLAAAETASLNNPQLTEIKDAWKKVMEDRQKAASDRLREARGLPPVRQTGEIRQPDVIRTVDRPHYDPTGQGGTPMAEKWRTHRNSIGAPESRRSEFDDTSPTRSIMVDDQYPQSNYNQDGKSNQASSQSFEQPQRTRQKQRYPDEAGPSGEQAYTHDPFYGDAHPSSQSSESPESSTTESPSQANPSAGGLSAWERVRRGTSGSSSRAQANPQPSPEPGTLGNRSPKQDNPYTNDEFGKNTSKSQAQDDFDAMLEQERAGKEQKSNNQTW